MAKLITFRLTQQKLLKMHNFQRESGEIAVASLDGWMSVFENICCRLRDIIQPPVWNIMHSEYQFRCGDEGLQGLLEMFDLRTLKVLKSAWIWLSTDRLSLHTT